MLWGVKWWLWVALALSLGALLAVNLPNLIALADRHEGFAAWVQAVGAIAGIAIAIILPRLDRAERKRSDLRKAYALIQSLTGSIFLIDIELSRVQRIIQAGAAAAPTVGTWDRWFTSGRVDIPKPLLEAMPLMRVSEDPMVARFRTVAMLAETFNSYMMKFQTLDPGLVANNWAGLYPQISGQFALLRETVRSITATPPMDLAQ